MHANGLITPHVRKSSICRHPAGRTTQTADSDAVSTAKRQEYKKTNATTVNRHSLCRFPCTPSAAVAGWCPETSWADVAWVCQLGRVDDCKGKASVDIPHRLRPDTRSETSHDDTPADSEAPRNLVSEVRR